MRSNAERRTRLVTRRHFAAGVGAAFLVLEVLGFLLGGLTDAIGWSLPVPPLLGHLPAPLRIAVAIVIGVPIGIGWMLYIVSDVLDFFHTIVVTPTADVWRAVRARQ